MLSFPGVGGVWRGQDWTPRRQDRAREAARLTAVNLLGSGTTEAQRRKSTHSPAPSSNVEEFRGSMRREGDWGVPMKATSQKQSRTVWVYSP